MVELQGGSISLESEINKGSTFSFQLAFKRKGEIQKKKIISGGILKKRNFSATILLVEDNSFNQLLASTILKDRGFKIEIAANGKEAIDWLKVKAFDLILMDIQMPIMDGYETTTYIRKTLAPPINKTPIIGLTAHASGAEKENCLSYGMDDYSSKPFNPDELCEKIDLYINKKTLKPSTSKGKENSKYKHINLTYLKKVSFKKDSFVVEMINVFIKDVPQMIKSAQDHTKKKNWDEIQLVMHKLKTNFATMGATSLSSLAQSIEQKSKAIKTRKEVAKLVERMSIDFLDVKKELKLVLASLKK